MFILAFKKRIIVWFEKIKKDKTKHILFFGILFSVLLFIFWLVTKNISISKPYAILASKILNSQGISNYVFHSGGHYGLQIGKMSVNILDVCTGLFELIVFLALIFANLLVSFKNKLIGSLIALVLFFYFNLIRILIMVWLLTNVNIYVVDVIHTLLFKVGFFIFFVFFYYIWLSLCNNEEEYAKQAF